MARNDGLAVDPLVSRLRAIARDLAKQHNAKGERIDSAVRRLGALADDVESGVEGVVGVADD